MSKDLGFDHAILSQYSNYGILSRLRTVQLFENLIKNELESPNKITKDLESDLNTNKIIATLQIALVSHLMMFIEDLAIFCLSFLNKDWNYYQYLDKKTEGGDLGNLITQFFGKAELLSNDDLQKILSYIDPEKYSFQNEDHKKQVISVMERNFQSIRKFFTKVIIFRENHIGIFRRYKHASYPFFMAMDIPDNDTDYKRYDFMSMAPISRDNPSRIMITLPFSKDVIESYENLNKDIYLFLSAIIITKLICIERKVDGVIPPTKDHFSKKYSKDEMSVLETLWLDFEKLHPIPEGTYQDDAKPLAAYTFWYVNLDDYSKSCFD